MSSTTYHSNLQHPYGLPQDNTTDHIIYDDGSIAKTIFTAAKKTYILTGVRSSTNWQILDAVDTWKEIETGKFYNWERWKLFELTRN